MKTLLSIAFGLVMLCCDMSNATGLQLSKNDFTRYEAINLQFDVPSSYVSNNAWVGLFNATSPHEKSGASDAFDLAYYYVNRTTSGNLSFSAPEIVGDYEFRLFESSQYQANEVTNVSFKVRLATATVSTDKNDYVRGAPIKVQFSSPDFLYGSAWVGLIPADVAHTKGDAADAHDLAYYYINGKANATFDFTAPINTGKYEFRVFDAGNGFEIATTPFNVRLATASLSLPKTRFLPNEKIALTFNSPDFLSASAWVGLFNASSPHADGAASDAYDLAYFYINQKNQATFEFTAPAQIGNYEFRVFDAGNGFEISVLVFQVSNDTTSSNPATSTNSNPNPTTPSATQIAATEQLARRDCQLNPTSCGIIGTNVCALPVLSSDLRLFIPLLRYDMLFGSAYFWAELDYLFDNTYIYFILSERFGSQDTPISPVIPTDAQLATIYQSTQRNCVINPMSCNISVENAHACQPVVLTTNLNLTIPRLLYHSADGILPLSATLAFSPFNNALRFVVTDVKFLTQ